MPHFSGELGEVRGKGQLYGMVAIVGLALVVWSAGPVTKQRIAAFLRQTVLRPFVLTQQGIAQARVNAATADLLQTAVDSLEAELINQRTLREENSQLRALLALSERLGSDFVAASVLRAGTAGSESMLLLDAGAPQGIQINAPIIAGGGLLGVVREVRDRTSIGIDWSHPDFRAAAMTEDASVSGFIEARQRVFGDLDRLLLNGVPFHQQLEPGTRIVTSGLGGVFPRGIPVGVVDSEAESRAGWLRAYWLRPVVDPGEVTHALVSLGLAGGAGLETAFDSGADSLPDADGDPEEGLPRNGGVR